jgi:hypothetical protein
MRGYGVHKPFGGAGGRDIRNLHRGAMPIADQ